MATFIGLIMNSKCQQTLLNLIHLKNCFQIKMFLAFLKYAFLSFLFGAY